MFSAIYSFLLATLPFFWLLNTQISHPWPFTGIAFSQLLAWLDLLTSRPQISHFLSRAFPVHPIYPGAPFTLCQDILFLHSTSQLIYLFYCQNLPVPNYHLFCSPQPVSNSKPTLSKNSGSTGETLSNLTRGTEEGSGSTKIQILMCLTPKAQLSATVVFLAQRAWSWPGGFGKSRHQNVGM